ncbi:ABC transporter permease [Roseivirga sp.]|uniref:ABC transporter permease n=1 Tax=Roseivirga sp. TaxID=1964215 RepID=UPI003B8AB42F
MTRNNFKIAARVLWHQKTNTVLNISSIAIGLACFLMISLYLKQELSFDSFHENGDRIHRVWAKEDYGDGQVFFYTESAQPLASALEENIPDVEATVQYDFRTYPVGEGTEKLNERIAIASPNFFDVFTFELISGNTTAPLSTDNSVVLSENYAKKYFGENEAVGKELPIVLDDTERVYTVSAVMKNSPKNSGFQFDMMVSNANKDLYYSTRAQTSWFNIAAETYVLLKDNSNAELTESKLPAMINSVLGDQIEEGQFQLGLQSLASIHLDINFPAGILPVGNPKYVYVLGTIGLLVLIMACINYTTLSTGQSIKRAKEVGVRKVVGANRSGLVWHFLTESILISCFAMTVGVLLSYFFLPIFNQLASTDLTMPLDFESILLYVGIALAVGLFTGVYPAFVLSKLKLISVLRGNSHGTSGGNWLRKSLVVFQLLLTVFLISGTLIMRKQMSFLQQADLGHDREAVVAVDLYGKTGDNSTIERIRSGFENAELLKAELQQNPLISDLGAGNHIFGNSGWTRVGFDDNQGQFKQFSMLITDPFYLSSFNIKIKEGRDFDPSLEIDKREGLIMNQAAVDYLGLDDPIGKKLPGADFGAHTIIGVTDNFNFESLHSEVRPLVIVQDPSIIFSGISDISMNDNPMPQLVFKYNGSSLVEVQHILENVWSKIFQDQELQFEFVDENLRLMYQNEARVNKIVSIATVLSILIAAFGLLGLTILVVNTRVKEIGIRKVLGATPGKIFMLLLQGFSLQLVIAILLSVPLTILLMSDWLNDFAYKVQISVEEFSISAILAIAITLIVISYHAIRAARSNPIKSLRADG